MIDSYMRYGALAAKVKALYGKRLRFSDFEHMAGLPNEQSILDYLRTQPGWSAAVSAALSAMNSSGYVGRMELEDALRYANAAAALTVGRRGAQSSIPTRDEVERLFSGTMG